MLVAHDDGIDLWTPYGVIPVLEGREVRVAFPDLAGGVVFSSWDERGAGAIEWIPALGEEPQFLVADPDAVSTYPVQVTYVDSTRTLVYSRSFELPNDCDDDLDPECAWGYQRRSLVLYDLDTGTEVDLGMVGSFESDGIGFSFGGDLVAVSYYPYGTEQVCSAVLPLQTFLEGASSERWIGEGSDLMNASGLVHLCQGVRRMVMAPDGQTYLEVSGGTSFDPQLGLRLVDVATRTVLVDELIPEPSVYPARIDYDGEHALVSQWDVPDKLLLDLDGTVTELDIEGRATLWSAPHAETSVTLRSDGVGPVSFGDPDEEVMVELTAMLGAPSWDSVIESAEWMGMHNGYPVDHYIRSASWEHIGLEVIISDGVTWPDGRGGPVLIRWVCGAPDVGPSVRFLTAGGVGVGSTVGDLRAVYGGRLSLYEDEFDGWRATLPETVPGAQPRLSGVVFDLTGDPSDPTTTVGYMWAGAAQAP